jgi:hypothetical protein
VVDNYQQGRIDQRLDNHDKHFEQINGSMQKVATNLAELNLGIQRLIDSSAADRATVLTTAKALKDAEEARRDKGEQSWSPVQRLIAITVALAAIAGVIITLIQAFH